MSRMTHSQKKTTTVTVVAVAALLVVFAVISAFTAGFTNWEIPEPVVHEDNLYGSAEVLIEDSNDGNGVRIDVEEETGAFVLNGKATKDLEYTVATIELDKGEYTLEACNKASKAGVYLTAEIDSDDVTYFDFTPGNTLNIAADDTTVTIKIYIANDVQLNNVKVLPVIYTGDESVDFYG